VTVVVDLGCANYGSQDSVSALIDAYHPDKLYGFDPQPGMDWAVELRANTLVVLDKRAAWLYDGEIGYHEDITRSHIVDGAEPVACFDFSAWLKTLGCHVILKMDVEGAEYELLERMIADGTDQLVDELLVEWHDDDHGLTARLACPVSEWWM
jgi:FkbM family methyltransferase